jgi:hypothetical protein
MATSIYCEVPSECKLPRGHLAHWETPDGDRVCGAALVPMGLSEDECTRLLQANTNGASIAHPGERPGEPSVQLNSMMRGGRGESPELSTGGERKGSPSGSVKLVCTCPCGCERKLKPRGLDISITAGSASGGHLSRICSLCQISKVCKIKRSEVSGAGGDSAGKAEDAKPKRASAHGKRSESQPRSASSDRRVKPRPDADEVRRLKAEGKSIGEIAREVRSSWYLVDQALKSKGSGVKSNHRKSPAGAKGAGRSQAWSRERKELDEAAIHRMSAEGKSKSEIARHFGVSLAPITRILKSKPPKQKVSRRPGDDAPSGIIARVEKSDPAEEGLEHPVSSAGEPLQDSSAIHLRRLAVVLGVSLEELVEDLKSSPLVVPASPMIVGAAEAAVARWWTGLCLEEQSRIFLLQTIDAQTSAKKARA